MIPPTPTPYPTPNPATVPINAPMLYLWDYTDQGLQIWQMAQSWTVVLQAIILLVIVILGVSLIMRRIRVLREDRSNAN